MSNTELPLANKVAIVTGAGGGVGSETTRLLATEGADIVAVDVNPQSAQKSADEVTRLGRASHVVAVDLEKDDAADRIVQESIDRFGRIDIVVNNAATGAKQHFPDLTTDAFERVFAVNTRTPLFLAQAASKFMIEQGDGGRIVNVSSSSGFRAVMTEPIYSSSKAALDQITRSLANALGPYDVNVNAVAPGLTSSPMGRKLGDDATMQAAVEQGPLANLLRRVSTPSDVAEVICFLCLPASRQITGQTVHTSAGNIV